VTYAATAEENWRLAEEAFADEDYAVAQRYYSYIRNKYPYTSFAAPSSLRLGDCQFERERYIESIDSYQNFTRLYPTHEKVPYAMLRIGLSYYEQIPSDWFMLPPSEEKEQSAVRDAERALRDYVERFPEDEGQKQGKEVLTDVRKKLLAHERYVANFYKNIGKDRAYVGRLEVIRRDFKDVGVDDELLFDITAAWAGIGELDRAKSAAKELEEKFPSSPRIPEAKQAIAAAAQKAPAQTPPADSKG
jgi:outer membrane protein assembly factor BamD